MNLISKPIIIYSIFTILVAAVFSLAVSFLLPSSGLDLKDTSIKKNEIQLNVKYAYNLKQKEAKKAIIKNSVRKTSGEFILTDFSISGILLSDDEKIVLVRDPKGGIFLYLNKSHKGYKLIEVYQKKAKFKKGVNFYWSFLNPKEEKNFSTIESKSIKSKGAKKKKTIRQTRARAMFEDIKFKNGKYFIPKDTLKEFNNLSKIFSSIAIQIYNLDGAISYKVNYISNNSIFYKLGLRRNDFIIKTDNREFESINEPIKYFQNLENLTQLSLTIKRNGQVKELKYEIY